MLLLVNKKREGNGNKAYAYCKLANHHIVVKSETCLVESFNSSLRDMLLARLNRRTEIMFFNKDISYNLYDL